MNRFKNYLVLVVPVLFLTGCATMGAKNTIESDCAPNFTVEGNLWTGTTYRSSKEFPKVTKQEAFDRVIFALASEGYQIINSNKEQGLISASEGVHNGERTNCSIECCDSSK